MALSKHSLKILQQDVGKRLDHFLAERLPSILSQQVSRGKVRKLIVAGAVYINRKRVRIASKPLATGSLVEVYIDIARLTDVSTERAKQPFRMTENHVLFEDAYIIVVDKPMGLPTQPTLDEARDNLFAAVKRYLKEKTGAPEPYVGLHHRLDRDTSGVVLFTKEKGANAGVAEFFAKHLAKKTYQAIAQRPKDSLLSEWTVKNYLGPVKNVGKAKKFGSVRSGGDFAETDFTLKETMQDAIWVEARPKTGRTHQIRVHLSEGGAPILGDSLYGRGGEFRMMLHASRLVFPHPIHKSEMSVESRLPDDFLKCLDAFRRKK